jgi:hypothetical protein
MPVDREWTDRRGKQIIPLGMIAAKRYATLGLSVSLVPCRDASLWRRAPKQQV